LWDIASRTVGVAHATAASRKAELATNPGVYKVKTALSIVAMLMFLGCEGPQGAEGPPGAAPSAEEIARAVIAEPEFKKLIQEISKGAAGSHGASKPVTVLEGRAGEKLSKAIVVKVSGTGYLPSSHLMDLTVQTPVYSEDGARVTVEYGFESLDGGKVLLYCALPRKYDRMGQGWWLRLADGTRVHSKSSYDRYASPGKPSKGAKCVFNLTPEQAAKATKLDLIWVPSSQIPDLPKDDMNRMKPGVIVHLKG
jgi:hypothetical protein